MAKKHHDWLVWPKDNSTNEAISKLLQDGDNGFEQRVIRDILCADGIRRNLWRCTETEVYFLWRSAGLNIKIFNRLGVAKPRDVTFLFKKDQRSPSRKPAKKRKLNYAKL